jgi:hypothetical protein
MIVKPIVLWLMLLAALPAWGQVPAPESGPRAVVLEFFFEVGCESCAEVRQTVLPELARRYSGYYELRERDIGLQSNYLALVRYQELAHTQDNEPVSMVVAGRTYLAGVARIKAQLFPAIDSALSRQLLAETSDTTGEAALRAREAGTLDLQRRVERFTLPGVILAAVVDSINPCAISALVFFMSLMSAARMGVSRMWISGLAFLAACFVTYLGIGFGLLKVLGFLTAVREWRGIIDWTLVAVMAGFAFFSFRDAVRYHRTGLASDVSLKLPDSIQARIHRVMKSGVKSHHLILGGLGMGAAVTLLESVCTGQVYVPALVMMLKCGQSTWRCLAYLLLYNAIFVLPLLLVLGLTCAGLKTPALVAWSRRNVVLSKILLGMLFLGMIALMVLLR